MANNALQHQEFVNLSQAPEGINLLRRIANTISEDLSWSILSRLIILILLTCLYGWLTYDFYDANGFTLSATTDIFCMVIGSFIVLCGFTPCYIRIKILLFFRNLIKNIFFP